MPRSLVHVLLSLLLFVTQQMSLLHGVAHAAGVQQAPERVAFADAGLDGGGKASKAALYDLCSQCTAGAQLAFALPVAAVQFVPIELAYDLGPSVRSPGICRLTICAFRSRAPPQA